MNENRKPVRRWRKVVRLVALIVVLVLFVPYAASRWKARARRVDSVVLDINASHSASNQYAIAAYNIAHGRGLAESNWDGGDLPTRNERLNRIAELIRKMDADVVVLNEVDFDCSWSGRHDQATYIARKLGYKYVARVRNVDARMLIWTWSFGNAILSKHPIESVQLVEYPAYVEWENALAGCKRGMIATINLNGSKVDIAAIHLSHRDRETRVGSVKAIFEMERNNPLILAGDFNSTPTTESTDAADTAIDLIDNIGEFQRFDGGKTFHSSNPDRTIDWIITPDSFRVLSYEVQSSDLSDHLPVVATIEIPSEN